MCIYELHNLVTKINSNYIRQIAQITCIRTSVVDPTADIYKNDATKNMQQAKVKITSLNRIHRPQQPNQQRNQSSQIPRSGTTPIGSNHTNPRPCMYVKAMFLIFFLVTIDEHSDQLVSQVQMVQILAHQTWGA